MIWPWGTLAYALIAVFVTRAVAGHVAWSLSDIGTNRYNYTFHRNAPPPPSAWQWTGAICAGACVATIWPVALAWALAGRVGPTVGAELEAKNRLRAERLAEREREVARMERELRIGEHSETTGPFLDG